jgi:hypothetical protein
VLHFLGRDDARQKNGHSAWEVLSALRARPTGELVKRTRREGRAAVT